MWLIFPLSSSVKKAFKFEKSHAMGKVMVKKEHYLI